ncbi:MAG TPA: HD domain-containing protein [Candidatus Paceibacterota bacterium]|nr:HD domain-containing protein [Candidatus Paceibacterota bacterium]HPT40624.1 HD domain-containing protein [Candidatus Paceibacterota bacterium]
MKIPKEAKIVLEKMEKAGFEAFFVGGCVRDSLMGKEPKDWDVTTNATPEQIQKVFSQSEAETSIDDAKNFSTFYENNFGTVSIVTNSEEKSLKIIEITPYRLEGKYTDKRHPDEVRFAEKLEDDLSRRDFTVNAMALKLDGKEWKVIDLFDGQKDLKNKVIRTVGEAEKRFGEDALRLMRAVRFASILGFVIEEETEQAIKKLSATLEFVSKERIRDEFEKIIMSDNASFGIRKMEELGLLRFVVPELRDGIGVVGVTKQKKSHIKYDELTVFEHNLLTLDYAVKNNFNLETRLAALFHDIAKPATKKGEGLEASFKAHEQVGGRMTLRIMDRLHFPKKVVEKVGLLVRWHFFFYNTNEVTDAGVRRLISNVGAENMADLLRLREADRSGSGLPKISPYRLQHLRYMIERVSRDPIQPKMMKLRGNDLMDLVGVKSGPKIGWILNALLEEVLDDPNKNDKEYLSNRAKELTKLSDKELENISEQARNKKSELEEEIDESIKRKYNV